MRELIVLLLLVNGMLSLKKSNTQARDRAISFPLKNSKIEMPSI